MEVECDASVHTLILSSSKDDPFCSWFDKLTTSDVYSDLELAKLTSRAWRLTRGGPPHHRVK